MTAAKPTLKKKKFRFKAQWGWAYFLIAPTIIGLIVLNIYPFIESIHMSLYKIRGFGAWKYVGLENFQDLLQDSSVIQATWNTLYYTLLTVPVGVFLALILASMLNSKIKGRTVYRAIFFLPLIVAPVAVAMVWRWMYNTDHGIINQFLSLFSVSPINWLSNPDITIVACAIIGIWSSVGYDMVLLLAGLQSISKSYYEASEIDGASVLQRFLHITLPLVSPTLFFVFLMRLMSAIKQFDTIYTMVQRTNPAYSKTVPLMVLFYQEAFEKSNKGYASAIVLFTFAIILIFTIIQFAAEKKLVHYD